MTESRPSLREGPEAKDDRADVEVPGDSRNRLEFSAKMTLLLLGLAVLRLRRE